MAQKVIIFVPGYMCSLLVDGKEREVVWPDKVMRLSGDEILRALERDGLVSGGPLLLMEKRTPGQNGAADITNISVVCGDFIAFMTQCFDCTYIRERAALPDTRTNLLIGFGYDWRGDLVKAARDLKRLIDNVYLTYGCNCDIWLIGHSMGSLMCRYLIESGISKDVAWKLKGFISIGGSNLGSPITLSMVAGEAAAAYNKTPEQFQKMNFLSEDQLQSLSSWSRHSCVYQVLPPQQVVFVKQGSENQSIYDPASSFHQILVTPEPEGFGVIPYELSAAKEFFGRLDYGPEQGQRPDYYVVYGTGLPTVTMFEYDDNQVEKTLKPIMGDGDGLLPAYSARFDGGWVKESCSVQDVAHALLLSNPTVLDQLRTWIS